MEMALYHHLCDLNIHGTIEVVHWDLCFGYVSNDPEPHLKVTVVKSLDMLGGTFVVMRSRRLYNCRMIHLMLEIHSTKNQFRLTIFKVTAD